MSWAESSREAYGTATFLLGRDVVTGPMVAPSAGPTRTEVDFLAHAQGVVATNPEATRWHCVVDNLDIHRSESLVRRVAAASDLPDDLGANGKRGVLRTRQTRAAVLSDLTHRIVFHDTPKPCSWLSILRRKLLKRGSFTSVADPHAQVLAGIDYYNRTMAWPFTWTSPSQPLVAYPCGYVGQAVLGPVRQM